MKLDVEEINSVKKSLKIEVPEEVVAKEISAAYSDLNQRVRIPGFRKGKAPRTLLEKRYGPSIEEDVIRRLVPDYYQRAVKEAGLRPVELPAIDKVELKKNAPLSFTALVEISPEISLGTYTDLKVTRPKMEINNLEVDKALETLQDQQAQLVACPEDHGVVEKDYVVIDIKGTVDGQPMKGGDRENQLIQVGSNAFLPGFEEQLISHRRGDRIKWATTFPKDFQTAELAGRSGEFDITIREVKQKELPVLDDEFAKDVGKFSSLEELKTKLREDLTMRMKQEQEHAVRTAVLKQLADVHDFEIPASLVDREVQEALSRFQQRLPKGMTLEEAKVDPEAFRKEVEPPARAKVKGRLILQAIADHEKLEVSQADVDSALARTAQELKVSPEDVRRLILSQEGHLDVFKARLREDQTLDWVVSKAVIEQE